MRRGGGGDKTEVGVMPSTSNVDSETITGCLVKPSSSLKVITDVEIHKSLLCWYTYLKGWLLTKCTKAQ